jgi:hypothetical protein
MDRQNVTVGRIVRRSGIQSPQYVSTEGGDVDLDMRGCQRYLIWVVPLRWLTG